MSDQQIENLPKQRLSQISGEEIDIINDIRELNFGRINIIIQDGVIVGKEITKIVRNGKNRGGSRRNVSESKNVSRGNVYNNDENVDIPDEEGRIY